MLRELFAVVLDNGEDFIAIRKVAKSKPGLEIETPFMDDNQKITTYVLKIVNNGKSWRILKIKQASIKYKFTGF